MTDPGSRVVARCTVLCSDIEAGRFIDNLPRPDGLIERSRLPVRWCYRYGEDDQYATVAGELLVVQDGTLNRWLASAMLARDGGQRNPGVSADVLDVLYEIATDSDGVYGVPRLDWRLDELIEDVQSRCSKQAT